MTSDDVRTLLGFYQRARAEGDFDSGIRAALERLLVSPDFLFRIEADPDEIASGAAYRVSDVELASRLSFFLWSSIPDEELLDIAIRGTLRDAGVLEQQVRRMLADPRARAALVDNFFGQWLQTRNVWLLTPDANTRFPWFDDNLRTAFVRETELFLDDQLKTDRGIAELLTADSTFLNEQLARHYGISGVYGSHFRRVTLADREPLGAARQGQRPRGDVVSDPHVADDSRQVAARKHPGRAGAASSAEHEYQSRREQDRQVGIGARDAGAASNEPRVRVVPCAHGPARLQPRELRCGRPVAHDGWRGGDQCDRRAARRHEGRWACRASRARSWHRRSSS